METSYALNDIDESWAAVHKATLLFVVRGGSVLLIRKKRGLGAGKINGPGGKLEPNETSRACAIREVHEELCITVSETEYRGRLRFQFTDDYSIDVDVYVEAIPLWFEIEHIPYDEMWADDQIWLPRVLAGESVDGRFIFEEDRLLDHSVVFRKD